MKEIKKEAKKIKTSFYLWDIINNKEEKGIVENYSVLWGLIENAKEKKAAVKFIINFDERKIAIWISDLLSLLTMKKMIDDYIRFSKEEETEDIDALLPELVDGVNLILSELREAEKEGKKYEETVIDLANKWDFTKEQTHKMLCLALATAKLVEDLFNKKAELSPYIY